MPRHRRRALAGIAAPAVAVVTVVTLAPGAHVAPAELPAPSPPAFVVPRPTGLRTVREASFFAPIRKAAVARGAPAPDSPPLAAISRHTPEGTTNIVELVGAPRREASGLWQRVRLAMLPNGTTGWVPRSALGGLMLLETRLVIDRARFRATLFRAGLNVFRASIGVGAPQWPTPAGAFYVRDVLTRYRSPTYGPIAFGTSARSATLTDWPAGGYIGIHGTDQPNLIPGAISHGCIRMRNADILRLARLMPVGTPIIIR
jgi:lipoprotein-anchoring transpeptidase ErfK/SrfK